MRYKKFCIATVLLLTISLLSGCTNGTENKKIFYEEKSEELSQANPVEDKALVEDMAVYEKDNPQEVVHLYITVLKENNISDGKVTTLKDLNSYSYDVAEDEPKVEVIFQEGSSKGPDSKHFGYSTKNANASMEVRGHSSSKSLQKSYKIKLYDSAGLWEGQRIINLNKHPRDFTRIRNKLSFDYFKIIPDITSMRTQFVNLHIKDLSYDSEYEGFVDYGLYTQIEQPNGDFLGSHGLDGYGHLYKAESFEFYRYSEVLRLADDPDYKKEEFEKILSIQGSEDHQKLLKMLDDVNNYNLDINRVVDEHFNRENMLTWLGVNILIGNYDTTCQNFLLYSPLNSSTWYFMPWDYDGAWGQYNQPRTRPREVAEWQFGLSNSWGMVLFNRFFKDPSNVEALNKKIDSLAEIINKEKTLEFLYAYKDIVSSYVHKAPDINHLPYRVEYFEGEYLRIADETEKNRSIYYRNLEKPMPIYLGEPIFHSDKIVFNWGLSFDLQEDNITYDFQMAEDPGFTNVEVEKKGLIDTQVEVTKPMMGIHYWRVIVKDGKGNEQLPFDVFVDSEGENYFGIKQVIVK